MSQERALQRLERLIDYIEEECSEDAAEDICHGHDRTDLGGCALVTDLSEIYAELRGLA